MPRGVYDRSAVKKDKTEKTPKAERAKKDPVAKKASRQSAKTATHTTMADEVMAKFSVISNNLAALSHVRAHLEESDHGVRSHVDEELIQNLNTMRDLRRTYFGINAQETAPKAEAETVTPSSSNGSKTAPLPAKPIFPVTPTT